MLCAPCDQRENDMRIGSGVPCSLLTSAFGGDGRPGRLQAQSNTRTSRNAWGLEADSFTGRGVREVLKFDEDVEPLIE